MRIKILTATTASGAHTLQRLSNVLRAKGVMPSQVYYDAVLVPAKHADKQIPADMPVFYEADKGLERITEMLDTGKMKRTYYKMFKIVELQDRQVLLEKLNTHFLKKTICFTKYQDTESVRFKTEYERNLVFEQYEYEAMNADVERVFGRDIILAHEKEVVK